MRRLPDNPSLATFFSTAVGAAEHPLLRLQRAAGNQAVLRALRAAGSDSDQATPEETRDRSVKRYWPGAVAVLAAGLLAVVWYTVAGR